MHSLGRQKQRRRATDVICKALFSLSGQRPVEEILYGNISTLSPPWLALGALWLTLRPFLMALRCLWLALRPFLQQAVDALFF